MIETHPIVSVIEHVTSPLTSAWVIFFTYKASHFPKIRTFLRAKHTLLKYGRKYPPVAAAKLPSQAAPGIPQAALLSRNSVDLKNNPVSTPQSLGTMQPSFTPDTHLQQHRHFSTTSVGNARSLLRPLLSQNERKSSFLGGSLGAASSSRFNTPLQSSIMSRRFNSTEAAVASMSEATAAIASTAANTVSVAAPAATWMDSLLATSELTHRVVPVSVEIFENLINTMHTTYAMPWWASMVSVTLAFRVLVLPLNVSLVRNTARLYVAKPEIMNVDAVLSSPTATEEEKVNASRELDEVFKRHKCHPVKNIVSPFIFPPLFLSLFGAVYGISTCVDLPGIATGGALWFTDLSSPDHSRVLPVVSALTWLATIELASGPAFRLPPWLLSATRLTAVAMIPITEALPAGVFMFWITSNLFAMTRAWLLRRRPIAALFGIPAVNRPH